MTSLRALVTAATVGTLLALTATGCSLASGLTSSGPATSTSAASATSIPTPSPADSTPSAVASGSGASTTLTDIPDHCPSPQSVLTDLGLTVDYPAVTPADTTLGCAYSQGGSAALSVNFTTEESLTPDQAEAKLKATGTTSAFQSVPGLGDAAFFDNASGGSYIAVLSGTLSFQVVASTPVSVSALTTFARDILSDND